MIELARSEPGIAVLPKELDADPWLLNATNGTINLRTAALRPHDPVDLITKCAGTHYDPAAQCPRFLAFLERFLVHQELIDYLQLVVGYILTGMTAEQVFFLFHGKGSNGKSSLIEAIRAMLGDYVVHADIRTFLTRRGEGPRNDLARLAGARLVTAVETARGQRLDDGLMKQLTGGEPITARFLFAEEFEFHPAMKLLLAFNHKPEIKDHGPAMWRRVRLVPFTVEIPEAEQVKDFIGTTLKPELPGILAWAVRGCLAWQKRGLPTPPAVATATRQYREESDDLASFLAERCRMEPGLRVGATALFQAFRSWASESGIPAISQKEFGTQLGERDGLIRVKSRAGIVWHGITLVNDVNDCEGSPGVLTHARAREEGVRRTVHNGAHGSHDGPEWEDRLERAGIQEEGAA